MGTGTGIWAIEFADKYPPADVLGINLSPIQPLSYVNPSEDSLSLTEVRSVPANCRFEVDDAEDEWLYTQKFDFIHTRLVAFGFKDPEAVFGKAFDFCAPGGYFQISDTILHYRYFPLTIP